MKKFEAFLTDELLEDQAVSVREKIQNVCVALVAVIIWVICIDKVIGILHTPAQFGSPTYFDLLGVMLFAPLWEELAFRVGPFFLVRIFGKNLLVPVFIMSCIVFGWLHGYGIISLLIQGVCGIALAWVYVKNGFSYWSSVALHALYNTFCVLFF